MKYGDRVRAKAGTLAEIWSEGNEGVIVEMRDPKSYSGNDSNNLIRWDGSSINIGFRPEEVELC
jgi:hypothetical protein